MNILSWNINSVKTKTEKTPVEIFLKTYDIICLNEIKTDLPVLFPGYVFYTSYDKANANRGGTCILISNYLNRFVFDIDSLCDLEDSKEVF